MILQIFKFSLKLIHNIPEGRRLHFGHKSTQTGLFCIIMPALIFPSLQVGGMRDGSRCILSISSRVPFKSGSALTKMIRDFIHSQYLCILNNNYIPLKPESLWGFSQCIARQTPIHTAIHWAHELVVAISYLWHMDLRKVNYNFSLKKSFYLLLCIVIAIAQSYQLYLKLALRSFQNFEKYDLTYLDFLGVYQLCVISPLVKLGRTRAVPHLLLSSLL